LEKKDLRSPRDGDEKKEQERERENETAMGATPSSPRAIVGCVMWSVEGLIRHTSHHAPNNRSPSCSFFLGLAFQRLASRNKNF
jgi:hypothetical protein